MSHANTNRNSPAADTPSRWARVVASLPVIAVVALVLLFFWKLAFTNLILARGDTFLYFYPYWDFRARALLAGHLPLWDPLLFMGAPFLANSQAGVLYPLNWPLAWLPAPQAVKLAIVFHMALAAVGTYVLARQGLGQSALAAGLAAALFSLGGYLTSQIEHVNQLQGLAWLPWLMLSAHVLVERLGGPPRSFRRAAPPAIVFAIIVALQILAGHTQSAFISLAGCGLYAIVMSILQAGTPTPAYLVSKWPLREWPLREWLVPRKTQAEVAGAAGEAAAGAVHNAEVGSSPNPRSSPGWIVPTVYITAVVLAMATLSAIGLAAAQVLPTLELSSQSLRGGGLPLREALSFSLDPRLLGRALLPGYSRALFSEFVAYIGLAGFALAVAGLRRRPERLAVLAVAAIGLGFALGAYDPLYALLAAWPPFNLFRAPARWLALFALAGALLAGYGLDEFADASRRRKVAMLLAPLGLVALTPLAARLVPAGETGPLGLPHTIDVVGWLVPLAALAIMAGLPGRPAWRAPLAAVVAIVELFVAGWVLPYNHLTTPEAYSSIRPAMTQLLAPQPALPVGIAGSLEGGNLIASSNFVTTVTTAGAAPVDPRLSLGVPARFLSISALRFDPGDLAELRSELDPQLPADAVYDAVIATKNKEVLSPNLPLAWGIPAVDGYDGGVLPLRDYAEFTRLFTGAPSADGRLRENLTSAPHPRLLSLVNGRYLVTDKVDDAWVNGVFYDLQFTLTLAAGQSAQIAYVPSFQATALGVVADSYSGQIAITTADGANFQLPVTNYQLLFPKPNTPAKIVLTGPLTIRGLSLVDQRSGAFQSLTLGPYRLVHSGDVKIYENLAVLPRAFVAANAVVMPDDSQARAALADSGFDPSNTVILADVPAVPMPANAIQSARAATITVYSPEQVLLTAEGPGTLLLTDAFYPGWTATIDGQPAPIQRADIMFRGLALPPGQHQIEFSYNPRSVWIGFVVSALAWTGLLILSFRLLVRNRTRAAA